MNRLADWVEGGANVWSATIACIRLKFVIAIMKSQRTVGRALIHLAPRAATDVRFGGGNACIRMRYRCPESVCSLPLFFYLTHHLSLRSKFRQK